MTGTRLAGRAVLVTGAGQGIGRGIALALAKEGAQVALAGRTEKKCAAVVAEIEAVGGTAISLACDVAQRSEVDRAVEATVERFGGLYGLVNNAVASAQQPIEEITDADVELSWRSGAMGTLYAMQAALPHLRAGGGGSIVNFGSSTAVKGNGTFGAYAMAKEAIRGLSRVAAREWGRYNIRVNVVVPVAMSPASEEFSRDHPDRFAAMQNSLALRRVGDCETDLGRGVLALMSDDLSYLTGDTLMLTGGM
ncbi:SDR family NAD(P)-dependent oxidoreductase [Nocardia flavorosea]|uniref:SDR family oxidoreductase n=1 Tax=Nocardia flavorosea TaxID=53429 RepID=A0A846YN14_9NOCA|nr:SDR family NAD(P)-dependent oxidoreductase [Nocardia flavorosea]NKY60507.1 SDR family oxidoreductase [Nocardia flavorosea]